MDLKNTNIKILKIELESKGIIKAKSLHIVDEALALIEGRDIKKVTTNLYKIGG